MPLKSTKCWKSLKSAVFLLGMKRTKGESSESLDSYKTALMKLSENCGFGTLHESLVRDRLILGVMDDRIWEKLLREHDLDLDKAIEMIKASQVTQSRASEIAGEDINAVKHKPKPQRKSDKRKAPKKFNSERLVQREV